MVQRIAIKRFLVLLIIMALSISMVLPVMAIEPSKPVTEQISTLPKFPPIFISAKSTIELKQANILPTSNGKTVVFTFTINNKDNTELQFIDYWAKLTSKAGTKFSVKLIEADKDKNRIPSQSSKDFTFYSSVNSNVQLQNLIFQLIKWDFSQANYERKLGQFTIPAKYDVVTPLHNKRFVDIAGTLIKTSVNEMKINKSDDLYLTTIEYQLENTGIRSVKIPGYQFYIRTENGTIYQLDTASLENVSIQPKEKKKLQLSVSIPTAIILGKWQLVVTIPEGTEKVDLPIASYMLPAGNSGEASATPIQEKRLLDIDNMTVSSYVRKLSVEGNNKENTATVFFNLENNGIKTVKIPNYHYYLRTSKGVTYPMTTETKDLAINPAVNKEIELNVTLPISVDIKNMELVVNQPVTSENKSEYPIAAYIVPDQSKEEFFVGWSYAFPYKTGVFLIKLNNVQRLPWEDQDILVADVTLSNHGVNSLPIPDMTAYFSMDGVKIDAARTKLVKLDNILAIKPGGSMNMVVYVKVPYTYEYKEMKLVLQEAAAATGTETNPKTLIEFKANSDLFTFPVVEVDQTHYLSTIGKRAGIKVLNTTTYKGKGSSLVYTVVEMENLEKRLTKLPKLEGSFKTADNVYYPATLSEVKQAVSPNDKVLVGFWSKVPNTVQIPQLQLVIGEGLAGDTIATAEIASDAFMRASAFNLPPEITTLSWLTNLYIQPYTLSINSVEGEIDPTTFKKKVNFRYHLSESSPYEVTPTGHKLVMEFVDGPAIYSKEYDIDGTSGNSLMMGDHSSEISIDVADYLNGGRYSFQLHVYDSFEGYRKLIGYGIYFYNNEN